MADLRRSGNAWAIKQARFFDAVLAGEPPTGCGQPSPWAAASHPDRRYGRLKGRRARAAYPGRLARQFSTRAIRRTAKDEALHHEGLICPITAGFCDRKRTPPWARRFRDNTLGNSARRYSSRFQRSMMNRTNPRGPRRNEGASACIARRHPGGRGHQGNGPKSPPLMLAIRKRTEKIACAPGWAKEAEDLAQPRLKPKAKAKPKAKTAEKRLSLQ